MEETKKWWQSKGVLGGIIAAIASLLVIFGVKEGTQLAEESGAIAENIPAIIALVASIIGIWGRITAKKEVVK